MPDNVIKCKYCDYKLARFKGRGKSQFKKLNRHVIDCHETQFLEQMGFSDFDAYLNHLEGLEGNKERQIK